MKKKLLTVALAATMVVSSVFSAFAGENVDTSKKYDGGQKIDGTAAWNTADGDNYLISETPVIVKFTNNPFTRTSGTSDNWDNFVIETLASDTAKGITLRADAFGWTYGDVGSEPTYVAEKSWGDDWELFKTICKENTNVSITATKTDAKTVSFAIAFGSAATETYTITYPDGVPSDLRFHVGADGASIVVNEVVYYSETEEDPSEEPTTKNSPDGENVETSKPSPEGGNEETSKASPSGGQEETSTTAPAENETTTKPVENETTTAAAADENAVVVTPVTEEEVKAIQEAIEIAGAVEGAKIVVKVPTTEAVAKAQEIIAKAIAAADKTADGIAVSVLKGKTADEIAVVDLTLTDKDGNPIQPEAGKKVKITLKTDSFKALKDAKYVAAFRVADDKLVSLGIVEVKDGKFTIETDHFSTYVFTSATEQQFKDYTAAVKADASVNDASGNKTGDSSPVMPLVVLAVVALGAVVAVVASKKRA